MCVKLRQDDLIYRLTNYVQYTYMTRRDINSVSEKSGGFCFFFVFYRLCYSIIIVNEN